MELEYTIGGCKYRIRSLTKEELATPEILKDLGEVSHIDLAVQMARQNNAATAELLKIGAPLVWPAMRLLERCMHGSSAAQLMLLAMSPVWSQFLIALGNVNRLAWDREWDDVLLHAREFFREQTRTSVQVKGI